MPLSARTTSLSKQAPKYKMKKTACVKSGFLLMSLKKTTKCKMMIKVKVIRRKKLRSLIKIKKNLKK